MIAAFTIALCCSGASMATTLGAKLNVDNAFNLYISSSESILGTLYLSGNSWTTTYAIDTIPVTGSIAYLRWWRSTKARRVPSWGSSP